MFRNRLRRSGQTLAQLASHSVEKVVHFFPEWADVQPIAKHAQITLI